MRAAWRTEPSAMHLTLRPDVEDVLTSPRAPHLRMATDVVSVRLPFDVAEPHPDLLALAAYSVAEPWTTGRLRMDRPVSPELADAFAGARIEAGPVGGAPRSTGGTTVLSYSGGADSIAASELLPAGSPHIHLRRVKHPQVVNRMTHVRGDVLAALVQKAALRERDVAVVESDLEYVCLPWATFPVWWSILIGSILTADHYGTGSISTGTVLEARYLGNGIKFAAGSSTSTAHRLFAAAGIPLLRPTAALTEVGTLRVSLRSDLADLSRSCMLGDHGGPCLACEKCLRKELTLAAVTGGALPAALRRNLAEGSPALARLRGPAPYYMQNVLEYALARVDVTGTPLERLQDELRPTVEDTSWCERYFRRALDDEVPADMRDDVEARLAEHVEPMTPADEAAVTTWDAGTRPVGGAGAPTSGR